MGLEQGSGSGAETTMPAAAFNRTVKDRRKLNLQLRIVLASLDAIMLTLAILLAYWIRFNVEIPFFQTEYGGRTDFYLRVGIFVVLTWLLLFALTGLYELENLLGGTREYSLVFNSVSIGLIMTSFVTFLRPEFVVARAWLLLSWFFAFVFVDFARFWLRRGVYALRERGWFLTPALIVGTNDEATALAAQLSNGRYSGLNVLGFVAADSRGAEPESHGSLFSLGQLSDLDHLVERLGVEELVIATSGIGRADLVDIFKLYSNHSGIRLRLSGGLFEILTTGLEVRQLASVSLLEVAPVRLRGWDLFLKTILDYGIALAVVVFGAPLFLMLWLAVKFDSKGPAIHRRRVLGIGGEEFDAFKFRSMHVDGDAILKANPTLAAELELNEKLKDDPRITRAGAWLRKTSLDELPQALNVLRGEMSIVGPRMIAPREHERYGSWDLNLLTVKPGITGLWQVSGRSDLSYEERVRLDMNYIRNWTIWLDIQILIQTIPAVLGRRGAY